jgi:hypothetical protein
MSDIFHLPQLWQKRRWIVIGVAVGIMLGVAAYAVKWWSDWNYLGNIEPRGGCYFFGRVALAVPSYRQNDPRWGDDPLGATEGSLGGEGCAVSSAAMVLSYYGIDTDPQRLNWFLQGNEGYTPEGWIYWEKAAELAPDHVRHIYENLPSHRLIDSNLAHGNPVIVRLRLANGRTHFVVIAGKQGFDYLTQDPGRGAERGLYPLRDLGSKIEGLRFYEKLN